MTFVFWGVLIVGGVVAFLLDERKQDVKDAHETINILMNKYGMNIDEMLNVLNKKSGVLGVSGVSSDFRDLAKMNRPAYIALTTALMYRGVRALERGAWFLSSEHDAGVINNTLDAMRDAVRELKAKGTL